jgi:hypothetical protein
MVERSLVHAGTPHGRCLFHSMTAPKITGTRAARSLRRVSITHPPSVTPRQRARSKPPSLPHQELSTVWTPQEWLPPPVPRPRHYAVGSSPGHTNNNDNRWARARAVARGVAPRAQRNRPAGWSCSPFQVRAFMPCSILSIASAMVSIDAAYEIRRQSGSPNASPGTRASRKSSSR